MWQIVMIELLNLRGMNSMGFIIMILSLILGIVLTFVGISRRKENFIYKAVIVIGIVLVIFAIYLALPK